MSTYESVAIIYNNASQTLNTIQISRGGYYTNFIISEPIFYIVRPVPSRGGSLNHFR